jgi:hypothetical protein
VLSVLAVNEIDREYWGGIHVCFKLEAIGKSRGRNGLGRGWSS